MNTCLLLFPSCLSANFMTTCFYFEVWNPSLRPLKTFILCCVFLNEVSLPVRRFVLPVREHVRSLWRSARAAAAAVAQRERHTLRQLPVLPGWRPRGRHTRHAQRLHQRYSSTLKYFDILLQYNKY